MSVHLPFPGPPAKGSIPMGWEYGVKICFPQNVTERKKSDPIWLNNPNFDIWQIREK